MHIDELTHIIDAGQSWQCPLMGNVPLTVSSVAPDDILTTEKKDSSNRKPPKQDQRQVIKISSGYTTRLFQDNSLLVPSPPEEGSCKFYPCSWKSVTKINQFLPYPFSDLKLMANGCGWQLWMYSWGCIIKFPLTTDCHSLMLFQFK